MDLPSIGAMLERTRLLLDLLRENIFRGRDLRENSRQLREVNADYREYLREQRLNAICRQQDWLESRVEVVDFVKTSKPQNLTPNPSKDVSVS